tara:strand:+ start:171 stop:479 length:309 start_codon:yes stop_codon:yes gene_type:complete
MIFTIGIAEALQSLKPKAEWTMHGTVITWLDLVQTQPTDAEITAEVVRLQAEYDNKEYQRQRATEYPPIGDQLDALFHAGVFPAEMAAAIQAVKDKHPKGLA